jgi:hypothetical protein
MIPFRPFFAFFVLVVAVQPEMMRNATGGIPAGRALDILVLRYSLFATT